MDLNPETSNPELLRTPNSEPLTPNSEPLTPNFRVSSASVFSFNRERRFGFVSVFFPSPVRSSSALTKPNRAQRKNQSVWFPEQPRLLCDDAPPYHS